MTALPAVRAIIHNEWMTDDGIELPIVESSGMVELSAMGSANCTLPAGVVPLPTSPKAIQWEQLQDFGTATYEPLCVTRVAAPSQVTFDREGASRQIQRLDGPGILSDLEGSLVGTWAGVGVSPEERERRFDWTWPGMDRSSWSSAVHRLAQSARNEPPVGQWGRPDTWLFPNVKWIAPNVAAEGIDDPLGPWWASGTFTTTATETITITATADDLLAVSLDGALALDPVRSPDDAADETWSRRFIIPAGTHHIGAKVENVPRLGAGNASMFILAVSRQIVVPGGFDEELIYSTSATNWKVLPAGSPAPGATVGEVIIDMRDRATAAGEPFGHWALTFTATHTSSGAPWIKRQPWIFDSRKSVLAALEQMRDAGEVEYLPWPTGFTLRAWTKGAAGTDRSTTEALIAPSPIAPGTVSRLEHDVDMASLVSRIIVFDANGSFAVGGSGGRTISLDLTAEEDRWQSLTVANETLDRLSSVVTGVKATLLPTTTLAGPDRLWVGDIVAGTSSAGATADQRIVAMSWRQGDSVEWIPELDAIKRDGRARLASAMNWLSPGLAGGRSAAVAPSMFRQPAPTRLDKVTFDMSSYGPANEISDAGAFTTGPVEVTRRCRALRLSIKATALHADGKPTTGSSTVSVTRNGSVIGSATLTSGTLTEYSIMSTTLQIGQEIAISITTRGAHVNVTAQLMCAALP